MPSNKPPAVQAAVLAKRMNGDSKRQIAEDLEISRNTVTRILTDTELTQVVAEGKTGIYRLIPKAVKAFEHALDKNRTSEAELILRSTGVLPQEQVVGGSSTTVNLGVFPER